MGRVFTRAFIITAESANESNPRISRGSRIPFTDFIFHRLSSDLLKHRDHPVDILLKSNSDIENII